jgi:hypothetical protein
MVEQAKEKAGQLVDQARETVQEQLGVQKDRAAASLGSVAAAIRETSASLRNRDQRAVGQYTERIADWADEFTGYLRSSDINQLVGEVEQFGRRRPAVFLGGAFLLGFMAARFLKSSNPAAERNGGVSARESLVRYEDGQATSWSSPR